MTAAGPDVLPLEVRLHGQRPGGEGSVEYDVQHPVVTDFIAEERASGSLSPSRSLGPSSSLGPPCSLGPSRSLSPSRSLGPSRSLLCLSGEHSSLLGRLAEGDGWAVTSLQPACADDAAALGVRLQQSEFDLVVAAVPGRTFSQLLRLSSRASRSLRHPLGGGRGRAATMQEEAENEQLRLTCEVLLAASAAGVHWLLLAPASSLAWRTPWVLQLA